MPNRSIEIPNRYITVLDAAVLAGVATTIDIGGETLPARRCVVGSVGAAGITLTRPDGVVVVMSKAQVDKLGGVVDRQFIAIQSDDSTDIGVDW